MVVPKKIGPTRAQPKITQVIRKMVVLHKEPQVFGTILISPDKKILLVKGRKTGKWSFPKGHPKENEQEIPCARRETYEETGIHVTTSYDDVITLSAGRYYVYYMKEKVRPTPPDSREVMKAEWWSMREMYNLPHNIDISYFLRHFPEVVYQAF